MGHCWCRLLPCGEVRQETSHQGHRALPAADHRTSKKKRWETSDHTVASLTTGASLLIDRCMQTAHFSVNSCARVLARLQRATWFLKTKVCVSVCVTKQNLYSHKGIARLGRTPWSPPSCYLHSSLCARAFTVKRVAIVVLGGSKQMGIREVTPFNLACTTSSSLATKIDNVADFV